MALFYLDNDVSVRLCPLLQGVGHQTIHTRERTQQRAHDEVQLVTALDLGGSLITHNYNDFAMLHRAWDLWRSRWGVSELHPPIIVLPHGPDVQLMQYVMTLLSSGLPGPSTLYRYRPRFGTWVSE